VCKAVNQSLRKYAKDRADSGLTEGNGVLPGGPRLPPTRSCPESHEDFIHNVSAAPRV